jgi:hypothetical protein
MESTQNPGEGLIQMKAQKELEIAHCETKNDHGKSRPLRNEVNFE